MIGSWYVMGGRWLATPLLFVPVFVELSDVVLALDALPAALSVTSDPAIITSANLFALPGLRSLYSLLADVAERLHYLKSAVAVILAFIAVTLVLEHVWGAYPLSTLHSLGVILMVMAVAVVRSVRADDPAGTDEPGGTDEPVRGDEPGGAVVPADGDVPADADGPVGRDDG